MKKIKALISIICTLAILVSGALTSAAVPVTECSYTNSFDTKNYAPPVEKAKIEDGCLYYAILSTAGSYAKKYFNVSDDEADFNEKTLEKFIGKPDIKNFGNILYKSVGCNIGNGFAITSVEFLSDRGERRLKEKIKSNGAIVAAIAIPEDGLTNPNYYNDADHNFVYPGGENDKYHAISIVGWDDDYDVEKFNKDANGDYISEEYGAWICKNSYGTEFGDDGYFYLSYTTPLLYAAALEVSQTNGLDLILKASRLVNHIGYIYGVNVRAYSSTTEEISVCVGEQTVFHGEVKLKNGCNLILFDQPVSSDKISMIGNNISTAADTVYCYVSFLQNNRMIYKPAVSDENWIEDVQNIWISVEKDGAYCLTKNPSINHIIRKNSNDNCYYIIPADGYRFTKDTVIKKIDGFDDDNLKIIYKDEYQPFKKNSTVGEAVAADYKRLKNGDGETFRTMIEFDEVWDGGRGRLKIAGQSIGSDFVKELNILTNEKEEIKDIIITFDDGSVLPVSPEVSIYKDKNCNEIINSTDDLNEYFADIKLSGYCSEELTVKINGIPTECEINTDGTEISVIVKISIPDVTQTIVETFKTIRMFFAQLFEMLRPKKR